MDTPALPDVSGWHGTAPLPSLACLVAEGPDAATFLHGQLSQDMEGMGLQQARLAAYCSAKGRMLADALVLRPSEERFVLLCAADVAPGLLKRLGMFVLRAKVKLRLASPETAVVGLLGDGAARRLPAGHDAPYAVTAGTPMDDTAAADAALVVTLPPVLGLQRALWVGPASAAPASTAEGDAAKAVQAWHWLDVMSGVPRIEAVSVDQFVPQMVNYELVGGVNFQKGCYPGQEVVARSQYRGTLKRRLFLLHAASTVQAGQEVFSPEDPGQPAGRLVNVAPMPGGTGWSALAELKLQWAAGPLHAGAVDGPLLTTGTLPYEVAAQETA